MTLGLMKIAIHIPQSGTQSAATFVKWLIRVGDRVTAGDPVCTVETEKAVVEVEAPASGVVSELLAQADDEVTTEQPIGSIEADRVDAPEQRASIDKQAEVDTSRETERIVEWSPAQRRAAENLLWVSQHTAPASTTVEVDFETIAALKASLAVPFQALYQTALTYLPFIAFVMIRSVLRFPRVIDHLDEQSNRLVVPNGVHLGIAVARETGLIVPAVSDAHLLSFTELAQRMSQIAARARDDRLTREDLQPGTVTITNPGAFGSFLSAPIVRRGETSILCIDGIHSRVVPKGGQIVVRRRGNMTLAFDHRIIDGQLSLKVLNDIKMQLESFDSAWTGMSQDEERGA
jgi:pyruvate/2-oxoglutarate dehydrogenase complex dihydrolipoamide acyltransferase (E2) component